MYIQIHFILVEIFRNQHTKNFVNLTDHEIHSVVSYNSFHSVYGVNCLY